MLHAQVLRRNFSLYTRVPYARIAQSGADYGHNTVNIQRFRVRRPFFSRSRLTGLFFVTTALYVTQRYLGISVKVVSEEDSTALRKPAHIDNDKDDSPASVYHDSIMFLPTGMPYSLPMKNYVASDPEYPEYKRMMINEAHRQKLRTRLATIIRDRAIQLGYEKQHGKIDRTKGRDWIEMDIPHGPPPECRVPGVALTKHLEWVKIDRPIDRMEAVRIQRLLKPKIVSNALYLEAKRRARQTWRQLKVYVGWEQQAASKTATSSRPSVSTNRLSTPTPALSPTGTPSNHATASPANHTQQSAASSSPPTELAARAKILASFLPEPQALKLDLSEFYKDIKMGRARQPLTMVPGCVRVKGLVELHGARTCIILHVSAVIDPKENIIHQMVLQPYHINVNLASFKKQ